jgi:leucyl aminopeptidase
MIESIEKIAMNISVKKLDALDFACDALLLPLREDKGLHPFSDIDTALGGLLKQIVTSGEFSGKPGQTSLIHTQGNIKPDRILLIGLGKSKDVTKETLRRAGGRSSTVLRTSSIHNIALSSKGMLSSKFSPADFLEGLLLSGYRFAKYKKENNKEIKECTILTGEGIRRTAVAGRRAPDTALKKEVKRIESITDATSLARDLVNTPANDMTPSVLLKHARSVKNVSVKVIDERSAIKLGMGAYISVTKGSVEPPKFIVMTYKKKNAPPLALIGKSITFDSGGISLKPAHGMEKMKYDMAGGAAVLGIMKAVSALNLRLHLIAILPATENLPGGSASKPGDVVKTLSGKTVEIISTDAEGRLVLADAIGYAKRFRPAAIIDIATLTGACSIALGNDAIAMFGNDNSLLNKIKKASDETDEKVWQMPLFDEYREYIKSDIADLKNSSGRSGSLVTAGYFLKEFAGDVPWVHLDIAGTAWTDKNKPYTPRGATGIGVRLLINLLTKQL